MAQAIFRAGGASWSQSLCRLHVLYGEKVALSESPTIRRFWGVKGDRSYAATSRDAPGYTITAYHGLRHGGAEVLNNHELFARFEQPA